MTVTPFAQRASLASLAASLPLLHAPWWRTLSPSLCLTDSPHAATTLLPADARSAIAMKQQFLREGYVQGTVGQWTLPIAAMIDVIARLRASALPPVFAFAYEEFWLLPRQLADVVSTLIGGAYLQLPDFWAWHVDPQNDESGWQPHRDKDYRALLPDGSPKSITLWIPLTAATPLNSCIYVVPADRDPTYGQENDNEWRFAHADIRALPAQPGDFLAWNQALLHWGSHASSRGGAARVSVAFEFQRADVPAMNQPLIGADKTPPFAERLNLIGKQTLQYQHMYPLSPELAMIAEAMVRFQAVRSGASIY